MLDADERQRLLDPRPDLRGRDGGVLEAEGDLVGDPHHHDLVLGLLEHRGDLPGELGGRRLARVEAADDDPAGEGAAVEVRHEARERADERRLARAGRAEHDDVLALGDLQRDAVERDVAVGVREAQVVDDRYSHSAPSAISTTEAASAARSRLRHGGRGACVRGPLP